MFLPKVLVDIILNYLDGEIQDEGTLFLEKNIKK